MERERKGFDVGWRWEWSACCVNPPNTGKRTGVRINRLFEVCFIYAEIRDVTLKTQGASADGMARARPEIGGGRAARLRRKREAE